MSLFDLAAGLVLIVSALVGWIRGASREVATVAAIVIAAVVALAALRFTGDAREIDVLNPGGGHHEPEFVEWRWEPMRNLPQLVVPFKAPIYERVVQEFAHLA